MTQKRFKKKLMALRVPRNLADEIASGEYSQRFSAKYRKVTIPHKAFYVLYEWNFMHALNKLGFNDAIHWAIDQTYLDILF